jgi:hypothetical protein
MIKGVVVKLNDKYIVRVNTRSCKCDTMEKSSICLFSGPHDDCSYGKFEDFEISYENYPELGSEKAIRDYDSVEGEYKTEMRYASERCFEPYALGELITFIILNNEDHTRREKHISLPMKPVESYEDKLSKLKEKFNSK